MQLNSAWSLPRSSSFGQDMVSVIISKKVEERRMKFYIRCINATMEDTSRMLKVGFLISLKNTMSWSMIIIGKSSLKGVT
jgi:hypothetical protein